MSPFFIAEFRKNHKCRQCSAHRKHERKFCELHLAKARLRWANWANERQEIGKCISCNRKHIPGQQRCNPHRAANNKKCAAWYLENVTHVARTFQDRKLARLEAGLCTGCGQKAPRPEHTRCFDCNLRQRAHQLRHRQLEAQP